MKFRRATSLVFCSLLGASVSTATLASAQEDSTPEEFFSAVDEYREENPGDVEGLNELVERLGGTLSVSTELTGEADAASASRALDGADDEDSEPDDEGISTAVGNFPSDAFTVSVTSARHPASTVASVSGQWNWRDDFAGQAAPVDIAALGFSSGCGAITSHKSSTYSVGGKNTGLGTLRDSGVNTAAPMWNINAHTVGFENQADRGSVSVNYDVAECNGSVQAGFFYEGNQGGSVVSVSAGVGGVNVGYDAPGLTLQKSSSTTTI